MARTASPPRASPGSPYGPVDPPHVRISGPLVNYICQPRPLHYGLNQACLTYYPTSSMADLPCLLRPPPGHCQRPPDPSSSTPPSRCPRLHDTAHPPPAARKEVLAVLPRTTALDAAARPARSPQQGAGSERHKSPHPPVPPTPSARTPAAHRGNPGRASYGRLGLGPALKKLLAPGRSSRPERLISSLQTLPTARLVDGGVSSVS
jgi:hypothetical protein